MKYYAKAHDDDIVREIEVTADGAVLIDGTLFEGETSWIDRHRSVLTIENQKLEVVTIDRGEGAIEVVLPSEQYNFLIQDELTYRVSEARARHRDANGNDKISAAMPGTIIAVPVSVGDEVEKGQTIVILESMKMENELKAPCSGVVDEVLVAAGDAVMKNQLLAKFGRKS